MIYRRSILFAVGCSVAFITFCMVIVPRPKLMRFSGAMQALQLWNAQRAYPNAQIDDQRFYSAFVQQKFEKSSEQQLFGAADQWRQIGPHNIGGRTLAVAINPQNTKTIYAGSASGGLWRSYNEGKGALAWHNIKTGFPVLAVSAIAIAPNDSNIMMIGTGEVYNQTSSIGGLSIRTTRGSYGIGILRTTNGGISWTKTLDWTYGQLRGVQAVKIQPNYVNRVWAATTEGIFKSVDTGKTWLNVSAVSMGTDLVFNPLDSNVVIAAHGNLGSVGGGIYRTTDGGKTWNQLQQGLPVSYGGKVLFAQYQSSPNVIFASIGNGAVSGTWLCKTTNYGDTWTTVSTFDYSTYQGWYSHIVHVDPNDSSKVICGGVDLYKSTNGGLTMTKKSDWAAWYFGTPLPGNPEGPTNYSHADHHAVTFHPSNPQTIYFGNDGGVFCSTDGGETFQGRNGGYQTTQFYNGFSSAWLDSNLAMGGLQDNATAIYDGTVAWRRVIGGDGCMTAMSPTSLDTMYGSSQYLNILRSANRGVSFSGMSLPSGTISSFVGPYTISESNPKILYAAKDKVYKTTNAGVNWTTTNSNTVLNGDPVLAITVAPKNPDTVYATTTPSSIGSRVFRTTNGGNTWTNITGTLPDRYMVDIAVDPSNSALVYVTASGFGTSHLFKSTNAGASWIDIGIGLPDVPTSAVAVNPFNTNHLYLGNDLGVYLSTNGGSTWTSFGDGLYDATLIMDLSVSRKNKAIRAVTHGNGVFERKLFDGATSVGIERSIVKEFRLEQNYPNPFNPSTRINYSVPVVGLVSLTIYDGSGKKIDRLVHGQKEAGTYSVLWNASHYASGVYFIKLQSGNNVQMRKMLLLK